MSYDHFRVSLPKLKPFECKWPVEERAKVVGGFLFCGRRARDGSPYCEDHHLLAYPVRVPRIVQRARV